MLQRLFISKFFVHLVSHFLVATDVHICCRDTDNFLCMSLLSVLLMLDGLHVQAAAVFFCPLQQAVIASFDIKGCVL